MPTAALVDGSSRLPLGPLSGLAARAVAPAAAAPRRRAVVGRAPRRRAGRGGRRHWADHGTVHGVKRELGTRDARGRVLRRLHRCRFRASVAVAFRTRPWRLKPRSPARPARPLELPSAVDRRLPWTTRPSRRWRNCVNCAWRRLTPTTCTTSRCSRRCGARRCRTSRSSGSRGTGPTPSASRAATRRPTCARRRRAAAPVALRGDEPDAPGRARAQRLPARDRVDQRDRDAAVVPRPQPRRRRAGAGRRQGAARGAPQLRAAPRRAAAARRSRRCTPRCSTTSSTRGRASSCARPRGGSP